MRGLGEVFVSHTSDMSTYPAPRSFVQTACEAVLTAGARPVEMAYFAAREGRPADYCRQRVRACDVYLAVIGFRYGSLVPDAAELSYTEVEFLEATAAGLPRLVFLLDPDAAIPRRLVDVDGRAVEAFRARLRDAGVIVRLFTDVGDLAGAVLHALTELRAQRAAVTAEQMVPVVRRRPWMAPPLDRMVERPELGRGLLAVLLAPGACEVGLTTGLAGAGGFGKTTLATWVCHRPEVRRRFPGGLLWVGVGQEVRGADLAEKVNDLSAALCGQRPAISDPDAAGAELGRLLDECGPVLLVVDDVWEEAQLRPFRFGGRACTRVVTTRIPDLLPAGCPRIRVDAMSAGQARELVASGVASLPPGVAEELAAAAGRWPVLLGLVNGALRRRVERGQSAVRAAEDIRRRLAADGPAAFDPARPAERSLAVAATVEASLALLDPGDRDRYLDLAVFPEDVDIPLDVITLVWPGCRVEAVCEQLAGLGLLADYRFDPPGPRVVLHDVIRAYLRSRRDGDEQAGVHRRLVDAASRLLPAREEGYGAIPWWALPGDADYLWRYLPRHLSEAGLSAEVAALVCDLRWVEAKTRRSGSAVGAEADLALVDTSAAVALRRVLRQDAHLFTPVDPATTLGATLASRLHQVPGLEPVLDDYRSHLPRPRLEPAWPLPDQSYGPGDPARVSYADAVYSCAFSPDGALLAATGNGGMIRLWQVADWSEKTLFSGFTGIVWCCAFSPDGTLLATTGDDPIVRLWRVADGAEYARLAGHTRSSWGCAFSPDGTLLATTGDDPIVRLWRVADGTEHAQLIGHTDWVTGCAFSPDGTLLATGGKDATVRLWRVADGTEHARLAGHTGSVFDCVFSPDGTLLATGGKDATVRLWRVADGTEHARLAGHSDQVRACAFSPDGTVIATTSHDRTVRLWRVADGTEQKVLTQHSGWVRACAFSPDGTLLATGTMDGTVRLWRVADGTEQRVLTQHSAWVRVCAFSSDGALLATAGDDAAVRLWRVTDQTELAVLTGHTGRVWACAFSPDGTLLATGGDDAVVRLWRVVDRTELAVLAGHTQMVRACAFSPDGALLATAGDDSVVRLWRVVDRTELAVLAGHTGRVRACVFSPDGILLATASSGPTVRIWNVIDGAEQVRMNGHEDTISSCVFSPDGVKVATASSDRSVRLWDVRKGTEKAMFIGHSSWVQSCMFSPDGTLLASTGHDGTVRLWRVADGLCRCALRVAAPLTGIAWHPGAKKLCAVGGAGIYMLNYVQ